MAQTPSSMRAGQDRGGGSRWLAALLFGVLLLLALLIASWFLRACAPLGPSMNFTTVETPAPPAPPPPPDPTPTLKASLDDLQLDEKKLNVELAALQADLKNKVAQCKPVEPPKPPPPPPPVAKAPPPPPPPPPPLPADRWAQKDLGILQGCWRLGRDTQGNMGVGGGRSETCAVKAGRILLSGRRPRGAAEQRHLPRHGHDPLRGADHRQVRQRQHARHDTACRALQPRRDGLDRPAEQPDLSARERCAGDLPRWTELRV